MILQISTRSWCGYIEMNFFVLLLAFRLVSSDKLDRTYLPPPGSKYAGGNDGDLDLPLEIPRESYTTTGRPFQGQKGLIPIDSTEPTIGINRGLGIPTIPSDYTSFTQASRRPFNSIQNKLNVPTTTISYAFTQTTTLPPQEGFESTLNPTQLSDIEGQNFFGSDEGIYPQNIPGQKYLPEQTYNQQGFVNQPVGQRPGYRPLVKGQQNIFGRPGSQTQFVPPGYLPTNQQAGISTEGNLQQLDQNRPESQIPGKQGSRPGYQNISGSQSTQSSQSGYRPGLQTSQGPNYDLETSARTKPSFIGQNEYSQPELKNVTFNQQSYEVNTPSGASTISPITGTTIRPGYRPESPNQDQEQNQYFGDQLPMNQQGFIQFTMSPQGFYQQTSNMQGFPPNQQIFDGRQPSIPPTVSLPQNRPEINSYFGNVPTQRPSQIPGSQPFSPNLSTQASPTIGSPLYPTNTATQEYPTTQSSFPQYGIDGDKGRLPGSQQQFGYKRPTQATSFQGTTSGTSSGPGLSQSYNEETLIDLTSPTTGSRQFGQNQYENANEKFSGQFETTPRPGITGNQQNVYSPQAKPSSISTTYPGQTSLGLTPGYGTTPKPVYGTTPTSVYPSSSPGTYQEASAQANVGRPGIIPKPERPQAESDRNAVILNYENILTPEGYAYSFDTSNGIHADESGTATDGVRAQGSYSYIGDDGKEYSVIYSADENGFLPRGDHLPTPPPIPEAIQRVIEQAERDKEAGIYHDGSYDEAKYGHKKYMRPRSRPRPNQKGGTIVNGVDIPESSDDNNDNSQPSLLSPDKRPNFGEGQTEQDNDDHEFDNGTKKSQMINRKPINRKTYQKPIKESILEDKYDQEDVTDEYGNVIKPILYKPSKQGTLSKRPLAPGRNTTDFLVNKPHDTQNESEDYYDRRVEQDDTKVTLRLGQQPDKNLTLPKGQKSKPGASTSSYSEITSNYMNDKDFYNENQTLPETQSSVVIQKQFIRPGSSTSAYSELSETQRPVEFAYDEIHRSGLQTYIGKPKGSKAPASSVYSEVNKQTPEGLSNVRNSQSPKRPSTDAYSEVRFQTPKELLPQEEYMDEIQIEGNSKSPGSQKPIETVSGDKIYRIQKPEKPQTGYQYIPPKNKFIQDERNRFPTRFPDIQVTTDKPEIEEKTGKPSTAKPFITPNVSRDKDDSYDDNDSNMSFKQKITYVTTKSPMTTDEYDHYLKTETDYENNPSVVDENYYNENAPSITDRPINPGFVDVTSTQRPTYPNQSTKGKPLFEEKTRAGIEKNPGQVNRNEKIPDVKYEKMFGQRIGGSIKPESNYSLNTRRPVKPTQKPNQYTTQPDPFYENTEAQTIDTTRQPGSYEEEIVTIDQRPATRRPSQKPLFRPGETPVTSTVRPEITIYKPDKSTTGYSDEEFNELEPDMIRSGVSKTPFSITTESTGDLSTTVPDYDRTSFSSTIIRPRIPGRPGTRTQIPSTTYRPNYSVISGQQPTQVSVDGFGRPITTDVNQEFGTSTTRPQYNIPSSMTRLSYNDKTKINQQNRYNQTFSPNEPRFGQTDDKNKYINLGDETFESGEQQMVLRPQNQRLYGTQNQNFDAQSPNMSFGMSQSTTEKVIGEDFSGPKRPQGFDPKYGYYY